MKNTEPLVVKLRRKNLIEEFSKAVRFHLTEKEQENLVEELLSHLENPPSRVSEFAELVGMLRENGGHLEATRKQCWEMAQELPAGD